MILKVYLNNCSLHAVDKTAFRSLTLMIELDLSDNKVGTIKENQKEGKIIFGSERIWNFYKCIEPVLSYWPCQHRQREMWSGYITSLCLMHPQSVFCFDQLKAKTSIFCSIQFLPLSNSLSLNPFRRLFCMFRLKHWLREPLRAT